MRYLPKLSLCLLALPLMVSADTLKVTLNETSPSGSGNPVGFVQFTDTDMGLLIQPKLENLSPGMHGFHLHQYPNCSNNGLAAGGHFDPDHTGKHLGPYLNGHQGDLPVLYADRMGNASTETLAPRLKVSDLKGHSLVVHEGGDNYSDIPKPLGGGGARFACGVIE